MPKDKSLFHAPFHCYDEQNQVFHPALTELLQASAILPKDLPEMRLNVFSVEQLDGSQKG